MGWEEKKERRKERKRDSRGNYTRSKDDEMAQKKVYILFRSLARADSSSDPKGRHPTVYSYRLSRSHA